SAHEIVGFPRNNRVRHHLNLAEPCQCHHPMHFFLSDALGQIKEVIREMVFALQPSIHQSSVRPVHAALFTGPEGKIAAYSHSGLKELAEKQVCTQMHVMMPVNV